jgi:hypothetical protein
MIFQEYKPIARAGGGSAGHTDRILRERELLSHAERGSDPVDLLDFAEARGDEHAAVGEPVQEGRLPRLLIALEPRAHRGVERWNPFQNEVAALLVRRHARHLLRLGGNGGNKQIGGYQGGQRPAKVVGGEHMHTVAYNVTMYTCAAPQLASMGLTVPSLEP